jgi:hypothetical protein
MFARSHASSVSLNHQFTVCNILITLSPMRSDYFLHILTSSGITYIQYNTRDVRTSQILNTSDKDYAMSTSKFLQKTRPNTPRDLNLQKQSGLCVYLGTKLWWIRGEGGLLNHRFTRSEHGYCREVRGHCDALRKRVGKNRKRGRIGPRIGLDVAAKEKNGRP